MTITDHEIQQMHRSAAMTIAASLPAGKEAALRVLEETRALIEWQHRPLSQDRVEVDGYHREAA